MKLRHIFVAMFIVMLLFLVGCSKAGQQATAPSTQTTEPAAQQQAQLQEQQQAPATVDKCGVDVVLTYRECKNLGNDKVAVSFINSGRGPISGVWMYVLGADSTEKDIENPTQAAKVGYEEVKESIAVKEVKTYEIDVAKWTGKLGSVGGIIVGPENTEGKVCWNQKQVFVPAKNCK